MADLAYLKALTEVGNVGVSIALMILFYRLAVLFNKTINNHFVHSESAYNKLEGVLNKLCNVIEDQEKTIESCKYNKK